MVKSSPASTVGKGFTVTVISSGSLEQLFSVVTTEYVVVIFGLTEILCVVAPVLHK